ncbi:MAG: DNA polymerase III subunit delta [Oscillospiraceae bacterium]|nr:DNA polymerase III subunit delta [Oscillospiraceae bacterium]
MNVDYKILKKNIDNSKTARFYFFYGDNGYLIKCFEKLIVDKLLNQNKNAFDFMIFDEEEINFEKLSLFYQTPPVISETKILIIKTKQPFFLNTEFLENFYKLISDVAEFTTLIFEFLCEKEDSNNSKFKIFLEKISEIGSATNFWKKSDPSIEKHILIWAQKSGKIISYNNVKLFIKICGNNLEELKNNFVKLSFFSKNSEITETDIKTLSDMNSPEYNTFEINKSIISKNYSKTFKMLDYLITEKNENTISILAIISTLVVDSYKARIIKENGICLDDAVEILGYKGKEFRLKNSCRYFKNLSDAELEKLIKKLTQLDLLIKTTNINSKYLIEEAIIELIKLI